MELMPCWYQGSVSDALSLTVQDQVVAELRRVPEAGDVVGHGHQHRDGEPGDEWDQRQDGLPRQLRRPADRPATEQRGIQRDREADRDTCCRRQPKEQADQEGPSPLQRQDERRQREHDRRDVREQPDRSFAGGPPVHAAQRERHQQPALGLRAHAQPSEHEPQQDDVDRPDGRGGDALVERRAEERHEREDQQDRGGRIRHVAAAGRAGRMLEVTELGPDVEVPVEQGVGERDEPIELDPVGRGRPVDDPGQDRQHHDEAPVVTLQCRPNARLPGPDARRRVGRGMGRDRAVVAHAWPGARGAVLLEDRMQARAAVPARGPVRPHADDVDEGTEAVTKDVDGRRRVALEVDRDALDVEAVLQQQVDQLDVHGEAVDPGDLEERVRDVAPKELEPALRIVDAASDEGPEREAGELGDDRPHGAGACVRGPGQRPIADRGMEPADTDALQRVGEWLGAVGQVGVRGPADLATSDAHARAEGRAFARVTQAARPSGRTGDPGRRQACHRHCRRRR